MQFLSNSILKPSKAISSKDKTLYSDLGMHVLTKVNSTTQCLLLHPVHEALLQGLLQTLFKMFFLNYLLCLKYSLVKLIMHIIL